MGIEDPGPVGASMIFSFPLATRTLMLITLMDGKPLLKALDKRTGETIHELELPGFPSGAPITYMIDGKQYICLAVGGAREARLIALALP